MNKKSPKVQSRLVKSCQSLSCQVTSSLQRRLCVLYMKNQYENRFFNVSIHLVLSSIHTFLMSVSVVFGSFVYVRIASRFGPLLGGFWTPKYQRFWDCFKDSGYLFRPWCPRCPNGRPRRLNDAQSLPTVVAHRHSNATKVDQKVAKSRPKSTPRLQKVDVWNV